MSDEQSPERAFETIRYEVRDRAGWLTLNRPEARNAISEQMMEEISAALDLARADDEVRVLVIAGAGKAFSAGYEIADDWGWFDDEKPTETVARVLDAADWELSIWSFPKPTIAAVRGWCLAGACEVAMMCDITVAADDARFGEPEIRFSSMPPALVMPWIVGIKATAELLLLGSAVDAQRAREIGMVNRVVPEAELDATVGRYVHVLAQMAPEAVALQKRALHRTLEIAGFTAAIKAAAELTGIIDATSTTEMETFNRIRQDSGLRAALRWRDEQFGPLDFR
jgi:enoyl-CoA hydratase/carnithine racemase